MCLCVSVCARVAVLTGAPVQTGVDRAPDPTLALRTSKPLLVSKWMQGTSAGAGASAGGAGAAASGVGAGAPDAPPAPGAEYGSVAGSDAFWDPVLDWLANTVAAFHTTPLPPGAQDPALDLSESLGALTLGEGKGVGDDSGAPPAPDYRVGKASAPSASVPAPAAGAPPRAAGAPVCTSQASSLEVAQFAVPRQAVCCEFKASGWVEVRSSPVVRGEAGLAPGSPVPVVWRRWEPVCAWRVCR